jgi:hypothetical protein
MTLRGPADAINFVKSNLEERLKKVWRNTLKVRAPQPAALSRSVCIESAVSSDHRSGRIYLNKVFAIRAKEDGSVVSAWMKHIMPSLPGILANAVGDTYTASLVRLGSSERSSQASIQIQTPFMQSKMNREIIQEAIDAICSENCGHRIPVRFSTGQMRFLAGSPPQNVASDDDDAEEDDEREFPHFKRYWELPGMGASIGLQCSKLVSATLGGYLIVDGTIYMLTVDHFITTSQKAENADNIAAVAENDRHALTSPSLSDVDDMYDDLLQTLYGNIASFDDSFNQQFGNQQISPEDLQSLSERLISLDGEKDYILTVLEELKRDAQEFILGRVAHRCEQKARESASSQSALPSDSTHAPISHLMDWSLWMVNDNRVGENRHRYRFDSDTATIDFFSENDNPRGAGDRCQETCNVEPNVRVYYVGRGTGRQSAEVNGAPMLASGNGIISHEWALISPDPKPNPKMCAGDSGAWIIRESDNKLVGQLYGWNSGRLLFTPINDVIEDIKETLQVTDVCLPHSQLNPEPPSTTFVCEVKRPGVRKPKRLILKGFPRSATRVSKNSVNSVTGVNVSSSGPEKVATAIHPIGKDRSSSPVPSLVSSDSSSPKADLQSPPDRPSSRGTLSDDYFSRRAHSLPDKLAVVVREDGDDDESHLTTSGDQPLLNYAVHQLTKGGPNDTANKENKHSVEYILQTTNPNQKANRRMPSPEFERLQDVTSKRNSATLRFVPTRQNAQ